MVKETLVAPKLSVKICEVRTVLPEKKIEDHVYFLTSLDQNVAITMRTVSLFHAKEGVTADPATVIREALVKLLGYYYPMAGRMGISPDGMLQVNYNSQGVIYVEASADANLSELGNISKPDERLYQLVYKVPESTNMFDSPIATVQVTKFKCGGFVFGLANEHSLLDGLAATDFLRAWSELARGLPVSNPPFIDRTILRARSPPTVEFPHREFAEIEDISHFDELEAQDVVHESFCFLKTDIDLLKKKVLLAGDIEKCSTFQVLTALVWRARTAAMKMAPEQQTRLYFAVDGRKKFSPPLPPCFMGNGIVLTYAMTTFADLCEKPLEHAVKMVQDAIALIDDRYMRSAIDYFELTHARPSIVSSLIVTTWSQLPFGSTNFGWGEPWQSGPVCVPERHMTLLLAHGERRQNTNVLLGLPPKIMDAFRRLVAAELA